MKANEFFQFWLHLLTAKSVIIVVFEIILVGIVDIGLGLACNGGLCGGMLLRKASVSS